MRETGRNREIYFISNSSRVILFMSVRSTLYICYNRDILYRLSVQSVCMCTYYLYKQLERIVKTVHPCNKSPLSKIVIPK